MNACTDLAVTNPHSCMMEMLTDAVAGDDEDGPGATEWEVPQL